MLARKLPSVLKGGPNLRFGQQTLSSQNFPRALRARRESLDRFNSISLAGGEKWTDRRERRVSLREE